MNPELEALIRAFDAFSDPATTREEYQRLRAIYHGLLADSAERAGVSIEIFNKAIERRHALWLKAQKRPSALPPGA